MYLSQIAKRISVSQQTWLDLISDDEVMKQLLRESPQGLIKFQMYTKKDEQRFTDRRLNRVKNKNTIPLGPWAHTVIEGKSLS